MNYDFYVHEYGIFSCEYEEMRYILNSLTTDAQSGKYKKKKRKNHEKKRFHKTLRHSARR